MRLPETLLGTLSPAQFLADYWQKRPLLIRQGLPGFRSPITPEELAGLACEEGVTARLILEKGGAHPWEVRYGPFEPKDFAALPPTHWTLLVQEVDRLVPEVAALLETVRFIPNWRLDDVMVSYAPDGGTVGAHIDNYDVFLVQAWGRRRWQINHQPVDREELVPGVEVRLLAHFEPDAEWILEPGDVLYLPPRIPHYGVALGDCMTFSIGFRAPDQAELAEAMPRLTAWLDRGLRYADPGLTPAVDPGEITAEVIDQVHTLLRKLIDDRARLARWFGCIITEPRRGLVPEPPARPVSIQQIRRRLQQGAALRRNAIPELAYVRHEDGSATLFASGEAYELPPELAEAAPLLTGCQPLTARTLQPWLERTDFLELLQTLIHSGILSFLPARRH
ncbi:ribosomal protein uL16 3-hydroxylase [Rhodothermus profundi]|uniref:50S ribosomal protein L16 3-hydroxylase n=1 Tax=Rhodothermus profundi TaxID=633813 RepID=A0A1M6W272_9BACT|nr:cupin domain-containing protein [Rhodothermus profundi]SHK87844.1 50S ribosomal protein L16 3-hydroxylase [Rhodothermus profundi]